MPIKQKNRFGINRIPIIITLAGLAIVTVILFVALNEASRQTRASGRKLSGDLKENSADNPEAEENYGYDNGMLAVLKELDTEKRRVTLFDTDKKENVILFYTGGTDVTDKFGQVISISQIPVGTMVDAYYSTENNKLFKLQSSTKAWEYIGVNNLEISPSDKIMKIGQTKYKFMDEIIVLNDGAFVGINNLAEPDELTVRGYDQTIWSITVTRGHGTVKLTDADAFVGGNVTVGYEAMQQVTEDLVLKVREGNFNLTVENGQYSGTKNITINRNQETVVSLRGLGPETVKRGRVTFEITPFGADLFIDGTLTNYGNPIELTYGTHKLEVSLGGYATYTGELKLEVAGKKIKISLPKEQSRDKTEVEVTEEEDVIEAPTPSPGKTEYNEWNYPGEEAEEENESEADPEEEYIIDDENLIYVQYPVGASVYLNGDYMGISPGSFQKVIGSHVLTFIKEGYETKSYTIDVIDDGLDMYLSLPDLTVTGN